MGATVVTTGVLIATAVLALRSLSDARRTRHGQLVADLSRRWDDPAVLESLKLFRTTYGTAGTTKLIETLWPPGISWPPGIEQDEADLDDWYRLSIYPNVIEAFGVFLSERVISPEVIYKMWGPGIISAWQEWEEPVQRLRDITETEESWRHFQEVAEAMVAYEASLGQIQPTRKAGERFFYWTGVVAISLLATVAWGLVSRRGRRD